MDTHASMHITNDILYRVDQVLQDIFIGELRAYPFVSPR